MRVCVFIIYIYIHIFISILDALALVICEFSWIPVCIIFLHPLRKFRQEPYESL